MINIIEKNVSAVNPTDDIKKLDGTYYGIICNVIAGLRDTEVIYNCSLYIPNVYDKYDKDKIQNYPVVEIPFKQDIDDKGKEPKIGELCKVMFENGDNRSCKLLYLIPVSSEVINNNALFIEKGILSTSLLSKPTDDADSELLKNYLQLLNIAYFITTGKLGKDITPEDFELCVLGSKAISKDSGWWIKPDKISKEVSAAKNYFCKPLGMPMYSYFTKDTNSIHVPIKSSQIYNIEYVILDLYNNHFLDISSIESYYKENTYDFSVSVSDLLSPYRIYNSELENLVKNKPSNFETIDELDDFMLKFVAANIANCNPNFLNVIFPDIQNPSSKLNLVIDSSTTINTISKCYSENLWYFLNNPNNSYPNTKYLFSKYLYSIKEVYEVEWLRSMFSLASGIKNIINNKNKNNKNLIQIILLCLTICPWMSYPMLGYIQESTLNTVVKNALSIQLDVTKNVSISIDEFRTYSTYLNSDEDFNNIRVEFYNLLQQTNISTLQFVTKFEEISKSVFGEGKLPDIDVSNPSTNINTWDYYDMSGKFSRLRSVINTKLTDLV